MTTTEKEVLKAWSEVPDHKRFEYNGYKGFSKQYRESKALKGGNE